MLSDELNQHPHPTKVLNKRTGKEFDAFRWGDHYVMISYQGYLKRKAGLFRGTVNRFITNEEFNSKYERKSS